MIDICELGGTIVKAKGKHIVIFVQWGKMTNWFPSTDNACVVTCFKNVKHFFIIVKKEKEKKERKKKKEKKKILSDNRVQTFQHLEKWIWEWKILIQFWCHKYNFKCF